MLNETQFQPDPSQRGSGRLYTAPNGSTYAMRKGDFNSYTAHTASGRRAGGLSAFSGTEPEEHTIHEIYVSKPHRGKGLATALMDFARLPEHQPDLHHSNALTEDGKKFASSTPRTWQPKLDPVGHYPGGLSDSNPMDWKSTRDVDAANKRYYARQDAESKQWDYEQSQKRQAAGYTQGTLF